MPLTTQQDATIKDWVLANPELNMLEVSSNTINLIVSKLNTIATPDFKIWKTTTPVGDIADAITWANFTPANPAAGAGTDATNWLLACQGKQFNLQTLISGRDTVATSKANIRAGFQDALTQIPSGVNGATRQGGWAAVQLVMQKQATNLEKLFSTGIGTTTSPAECVYLGNVNYNDVLRLMGW